MSARTCLPSIWWHRHYSDGSPLPSEEVCWFLVWDVGDKLMEVQLFADGKVEWFSSDRAIRGAIAGTEGDPEPHDQVFADPKFAAGMAAIKAAYDAKPATGGDHG